MDSDVLDELQELQEDFEAFKAEFSASKIEMYQMIDNSLRPIQRRMPKNLNTSNTPDMSDKRFLGTGGQIR